MSGPTLEAEGLGVRRGEHLALRDVGLQVRRGELLTLVGPSGSGKSSLLRAVAGLAEVAAGALRLEGRSLAGVPPSERDVGMVFQGHALFPHLSVLENIAFGLRARGARDAEARARAAAERLGLAPLLARRPGQLSGGERQRVALGRALVREPKLFLLDEPLSALDGPLRAQLREELVQLQAQLGTAMVLVTHDPAEALGMGHRVGALRAGRLEQVGTPEELYERPATLEVARLVAALPLTLMQAVPEGAAALRLPVGLLATPPGLEAAALAARGPLQLAVRPEDVGLGEGGGAGGLQVAGRVERSEYLGGQRLLTVACEGGVRLRVRCAPAQGARPGEAVRLRLDPARVLLFEAEGGRALARGAP